MNKLSLSAVLLLCAVSARAADPKPAAANKAKKPAAAAAAAMPPEMLAQLEKAKKLGSPGPEHTRLKALEGRWNAKVTGWMKPGDAPTESKGIAVFEWALGGRFLKQKFLGDWAGDKFEGQGTIGYDNIRKQYVSTWMDSMSTGLMYSTAQYYDSSRMIRGEGTFSCPMTGDASTWFRSEWVLPAKASDGPVFTMFGRAPGGAEYKTMEIVYSRAK